ncbi:MAG: hypothetical protein ACXVQZ_06110, partial [Gaiellaceae bacterium]
DNNVKSRDVEAHPKGDSVEAPANPAKDLRIPQKGYKVHFAVSPNPNGGIPMVKFAKLVKSAKIAGGLAAW